MIRGFFGLLAIAVSFSQPIFSQAIGELQITNERVNAVVSADGTPFPVDLPLLSYQLDGKKFESSVADRMALSIVPNTDFHPGLQVTVEFSNSSRDTITLRNVLPFGGYESEVYITGLGDHRLSRTHLFLPDRLPVNVIVPDNAWELGYAGVRLADERCIFGLARREPASISKGTRRRFETVLFPGGSVRYQIYVDFYRGSWQEGLRVAFQQRYLYDLDTFNDSLYKRADLSWIKKAYVMHLMMAWDKSFYDAGKGGFQLSDFMKRGRQLYGGDDVICIWPTWPSLGIDQRNQFDLYRDLPGGLDSLRHQATALRKNHARFFIAYNPWDESTRNEGHLQGLASLIKATDADGVVLDTKGESSRELQAAADAVRPGVVMYSEGMAVPRHMPGIVSGRVHNALYYPPMLNLNKFIRPDFAIFRVAEVFKEPIQREYAVAFFNGYGTEINQFAPGHPDWEEDQYRYLGRTTRILRENSDNFTKGKLTPLVSTFHDSVWVNRWDLDEKTLYTIYSTRAEGFSGLLFNVEPDESSHFVDLWHHEELTPQKKDDEWAIAARTDPFRPAFLGTNNEGEVDCIAKLPNLLTCNFEGDQLSIGSNPIGESVLIWKGNPSYEQRPIKLPAVKNHELSWSKDLEGFEGKIVVQLMKDNMMLDEVVMNLKPGTPRLISLLSTTNARHHRGMVQIPGGNFVFKTSHGDEFIPYPKNQEGRAFDMPSFWMDQFPVTNSQFKQFLDETDYVPTDTSNFLKHWVKGSFPEGQGQFPVVFVSYEDAQAFARWAGKRLPSEVEWQYAAQTPSLNEWPWKQEKPVTRQQQYVTETLTVSEIKGIDPKRCNLGDGKLYPVGHYAAGRNPHGLFDLVGCVWQLTNDVYESGSYRYIILKGGSYFKPSSSWWYVQGGPRELHYRQYLLRVSEGFERNATVGFRCVSDE